MAAKNAGLAALIVFSRNSERRAMGLAGLSPLPSGTPSKFVTPAVPGVPVVVCTVKMAPVAKPKYVGGLRILKAGEDGACGVAVKRDQRRVTVSAVAEAIVVPAAAVKGAMT